MSYKIAASTVDLIVHYKGGLVLVKRKNDPFKDHWALPGGFIEAGKETLEEAAVRELHEETGLIVKPEKLTLLGVYSDPNRDPRGHVIAHVYYASEIEVSGDLRAADDAAEAKAIRYNGRDNLMESLNGTLAFDHERILRDYFWRYDNGKKI